MPDIPYSASAAPDGVSLPLTADHRLVRIHGCSTSLAQEPAPPIKQIGRNAVTASGRRYRLAWFETLLNDRQLLLGCPPPTADITCQQFNVSILVRHKPIPKLVLEPFCLCRLSGRNGGQFTIVQRRVGPQISRSYRSEPLSCSNCARKATTRCGRSSPNSAPHLFSAIITDLRLLSCTRVFAAAHLCSIYSCHETSPDC
jgi:hypothetical protein